MTEENQLKLKRKLEDLGYNSPLPVEAVPLVECIIADLLQTTKSLQYYMDLSKEAILQRDKLILEAEPYKCDNARLLKENNDLHKEIMCVKEECLRAAKVTKRKIKSLSDELLSKERLVTKLQHDLRDLSLRGLCAGTHSSRLKSKRKENENENFDSDCFCANYKTNCINNDATELKAKNQSLQEELETYSDEILLLRNQVDHRDKEILRLKVLLEGSSTININKHSFATYSNTKTNNLFKQLQDTESTVDLLKKDMDESLKKQHEAMLRALNLADENKSLKEELKKVDSLALKVEDNCNKRLAMMTNEVNFLQSKLEEMISKCSKLEKDLSQSQDSGTSTKLQDMQEVLNIALRETDTLKQEVKDLLDLNKSLQDKILILSQKNERKICFIETEKKDTDVANCATKDDLKILLENERKIYEKQMITLQETLTEVTGAFNKHLLKCDNTKVSHETTFLKDLHRKLCENEQKILMLKKENEDLKASKILHESNTKENYKEIIGQLNAENTELSKENIYLSTQISHYKNLPQVKPRLDMDYIKRDIDKLNRELEELKFDNQTLRKDKQEYNCQLKEALSVIDKLKMDLTFKQRQAEQLEEENCSYKLTNRTGKASADHLKEECNRLKEQIKKMQTDVIKEKTLSSQIRNIQMETERSSTEIHNELLHIQKQLSLAKDTNECLEKKCKELQSEIMALKAEKSNLVDNLKKVDRDRDKLVIELDNKTEVISCLEQKLQDQLLSIEKRENEIVEMKRRLNVNKVFEHKLFDTESQVKFLNEEIARLTQQLDNAVIENKKLQNSLADANGMLKITRIEYEKSRKEVDGLKQQLQHYVAEIRRIEELLSHKEAERTDMLENFASLSVEANLLETTNNSLETESASKSFQLQSYVARIREFESKLLDKEQLIDSQSARIANMTCKITALENEVKLITDEKQLLDKNVSCLKKMCNNLESERTQVMKQAANSDSEFKLYDNKIKNLTEFKANLQAENDKIKDTLQTTEKLLLNARKEIVDLKLALRDATSETAILHDRINQLSRGDCRNQDILQEELELPLTLEETIHEISHEEDDEISRYHEMSKRFSKYTHGSTL